MKKVKIDKSIPKLKKRIKEEILLQQFEDCRLKYLNTFKIVISLPKKKK